MWAFVKYTEVYSRASFRFLWVGLRERDLLFQTLDTTMRRVKLPSGGQLQCIDEFFCLLKSREVLSKVCKRGMQLLLTALASSSTCRTISFAAFQSTLDEIVSCDVLLHLGS